MERGILTLGAIGLLAVLLAGCFSTTPGTTDRPKTTMEETGRAVFAITDAAADMGAVTSVKVTVDSVEVHSATEGWVTVSSTPKTYDLLQLKAEGSSSLMADAELKEGTYQQIRLQISSVVVTDADGDHEAKLPSGELKLAGELVVKANATAAATFDFVADESLHVTGSGEYIMAPVVQLETREDADVEVKANSKVEVKAGKVNTNAKVGMDISGNVGVGLKIGQDEALEVDGGMIKIKAKLIGSTKASGSTKTSAGGSAESEVDVEVSTY